MRSASMRPTPSSATSGGAGMAANGITRPPASPDGEWTLEERLRAGPLLLDGATGTELERRGVACELPLWSAQAIEEAPEVLEAIHHDYVLAGAEALTANTFRTHARSLASAGLGDRARTWTERAVAVARSAAAAAGRRVFVLGSTAPLEDCFRPDLVPDGASLEREHGAHARHLAEAGVDAALVETMNTLREARCAVRAARACGLPVLVSFVCDGNARLLSGEGLAAALAAVASDGALLVGVNCLPPAAAGACLGTLVACGRPFGVYANLGAPDERGRPTEDCAPEIFASHAATWLQAGARLVGGCCGSGPEHIRAVRQLLTPAP